jgi:putative chitinase
MSLSALIHNGVVLMANPMVSRADQQAHILALEPAFAQFQINTPERVCAALAQFAHETGGWRWLKELGGTPYFRKYDGRQDLGNTEPGDGARFRGRGYIQLTGRSNYEQMQQWFPKVPIMEQPELAQQPQYAALFSCRWWEDRGLNELADAHKFQTITRRINGGLNGYADRRQRYDTLLALAKRLNS